MALMKEASDSTVAGDNAPYLAIIGASVPD
jgi:hypothetical protein